MATKLEMVLSVLHDPQGRSSQSKNGNKEEFVSYPVLEVISSEACVVNVII